MYNQRLAADRWGLATNQEVEVCIPPASEINHRGVIYTFQLSHIRSEAVSPGNGSPMLMLRADCSFFGSYTLLVKNELVGMNAICAQAQIL
jgi:hypothetical protein